MGAPTIQIVWGLGTRIKSRGQSRALPWLDGPSLEGGVGRQLRRTFGTGRRRVDLP